MNELHCIHRHHRHHHYWTGWIIIIINIIDDNNNKIQWSRSDTEWIYIQMDH